MLARVMMTTDGTREDVERNRAALPSELSPPRRAVDPHHTGRFGGPTDGKGGARIME